MFETRRDPPPAPSDSDGAADILMDDGCGISLLLAIDFGVFAQPDTVIDWFKSSNSMDNTSIRRW